MKNESIGSGNSLPCRLRAITVFPAATSTGFMSEIGDAVAKLPTRIRRSGFALPAKVTKLFPARFKDKSPPAGRELF